MFNFKARDFFWGGFILGAIAVALIIIFVLVLQARSTVAEAPATVPEEPTRVVEAPTVAPEAPTRFVPTPVETDSLSGLHYILFNPTKPPLDDHDVRQTLRLAIDRGYLADVAIAEPELFLADSVLRENLELINTYPTGTMAPGFMQPEGLQDDLMLPRDPEKVRRQLGEAGLQLVAAVPPGQESWLYEIYKQDWAQYGIELAGAVEVPEQDVAQMMLDGKVDIYLSPARRLPADPVIFYPAILSPLFELSANSDDLARIMAAADSSIVKMEENPGSTDQAINDLERLIVGETALVIPVFRFGPAERE